MKFKAFTLAEVLITLAVIGIVAALTIPALVKNYQERTWGTASQVFERKLEEALKSMNAQETLAGYSTTKDFVNELSKHIKITKICENDNLTSCFVNKIYWGSGQEEIDTTSIKRAASFGQDSWDTETIGVQFSNGINSILAYNPACTQDPYNNQYTGTSCLAILYDVSGFKSPNTSNKDIRGLNVSSLESSCGLIINGLCFSLPFKPTRISKTECEELSDNGYGNNKELCVENDYWAGLVKQCGGINSVPTLNQLAKIADYVYNTEGIGVGQTNNLTLDSDKVMELGLKVYLGDNYTFWIFSNEEYVNNYTGEGQVKLFHYNKNYASTQQNPWRDYIAGRWGLCIIN